MTDNDSLSLVDAAFLAAETQQSPKHVGGLLVFRKPQQSASNFAAKLYQAYRQCGPLAPFDRVPQISLRRGVYWRKTQQFDIDAHLFYHRPGPRVLRIEQLQNKVAELHSPMSARSRPLWEFHIIDGVDKRRFAIYCRLHHAYADGITLSRWLTSSLAADAGAAAGKPLWAVTRITPPTSARSRKKNRSGNIQALARMAGGLARLGTQWGLEKAGLTHSGVGVPFTATHIAPLTGRVDSQRQMATAAISMDRINNIRKCTGSTLNQVALTCIDIALQQYLEQLGHHNEQPLIIQMPVSLRAEGDNSGGNKIAIVLVELGPKQCDPASRLRDIGYALRSVRRQIDSLPAASMTASTLLTSLCAQATELCQLSHVLPPLGHTLVSNVPGPLQTLYLNGARLESMIPVSTLPASNCLNITLFSYAGTLQVGLVASARLPALAALGKAIEQASVTLENAVTSE